MLFFNLCYIKKNSLICGIRYEQVSYSATKDHEVKISTASVSIEKKLFEGEIEVRLDKFSDFLPSGFLPLLLKFAAQQGYFEVFAKHFTLPMKSVYYSPYQKLQVLICSLLVNCNCIKDINHKLKPYPQIATMLGLKQIPDQSTINRFLNRFDAQSIVELEVIFDILTERLFCHKKEKKILVVDATGLVIYGDKFQFAKKGYFPKKRGNKGYQLSLGVLLDQHPKISALFLDPGNIPLDLRLWDTVYQTAEILGGLKYLELVIGDAIYGTGKHITTFIDMDIPFLLKGKNRKTAFNLAERLNDNDYYYIDNITEVAEQGYINIRNCPHKVRVVIIKKIDAKGRTIFNHLVTSIPKEQVNCVELFSLYNKRQFIESNIKENKHGLSIDNIRTGKFWSIYAFLYIAASVFNLFSLFKEKVLVDTGLENLGLREITDKLMDIPGKIEQQNKITKLLLPLYHNYSKTFVSRESLSLSDTS